MKAKKYMIIGIFILMIALVGSVGTYAWFTWKSTNNTSLTMSIGKLADVIFTSGNNISTSTLAPVFNYTDGEVTTFSINNKDTTGTTISYNVKLNITSIATELKSTSLKYVILKNNTKVKEGNFSTIGTGSTTIYSSSISSSGTTDFKFYLYIDANIENNLSMMNKTLSGTLTVEAQEKESLATQITNLYNSGSKTSVTNNSITYQYDTTHSLMKDVGNNIRYYGASPNNYIYFNCSDYSNQSSSTCEGWQIIGVFDGKVKLMRIEQVGTLEYDNDNEDTYLRSLYYSNDNNISIVKALNYENENRIVTKLLALDIGDGENNYSTSSLQKILNNYYYNGLKYIGYVTHDFTSIGFKNDKTRNMIAEITYNLGGINTDSIYSNEIYEYERGITVYEGNDATWQGKIALPYLSDYGYAADLSKCSQTLTDYNITGECINWMNDIISVNGGELLLNHSSDGSKIVGFINSDGTVSTNYVYAQLPVVPVLYLNSELSIKSGTGSGSDPYQLSV